MDFAEYREILNQLKRLGNTMIHDKHGEACITAVYQGGSFSHK